MVNRWKRLSVLPALVAVLGTPARPTFAAGTQHLSSGTGDGFARFARDGFGAVPGQGNDIDIWDPVGAETQNGATYNTFLVVSDRPAGSNASATKGYALLENAEFFTSNRLVGASLVEVSGTSTMRVTTFRLPVLGVAVHLTQVAAGQLLTQTYVFTNEAGEPAKTLTVARFSDVDMVWPAAADPSFGVDRKSVV